MSKSNVKPLSAIRLARMKGSQGYRTLMQEIRLAGDWYDPWGTGMSWLFALADVFFVTHGETLPEYRPAAGLHDADDLESESYETETVHELSRTGALSDEDMRHAYSVLSRYDDWLRMAGLNY